LEIPEKKQRKTIKKVVVAILSLLAIVVLIPILIALLLLIPAVQNKVVDWAALYASEFFGSELLIGGIYLEPFTTVRLDDVLIRDFKGDTLIFSSAIHVQLHSIKTESIEINLDEVEVENGYFNLVIYENDSLSNLQHWMEAFPSSSDSSASGDVVIRSNEVRLKDMQFVFENQNIESAGPRQVDFNHLGVDGLSGRFTNVSIVNDSITANMYGLQLEEKSGFKIKHFTAHASVNSNVIRCSDMTLVTNTATVNGTYEMQSGGWSNYSDYISKVRMVADLHNTEVRFDDIAYFAPQLEGLLVPMKFHGHVEGTVDNLKGEIQQLTFGESGMLRGKVKVKGLPNLESTFIDADVKQLHTTLSDAETINLPTPDGYVQLVFPDGLSNISFIDFKGRFTGFVNDFVTYGKIETALGVIDADINLKTGDELEYSGSLATKRFQLGKLLNIEKTIQSVGFHLDLVGQGTELNTLYVKASGNIDHFGLLDYDYQNLAIDGEFREKVFNGNVSVNDTNVQFAFNGGVDLNGKIPQIAAKTKIGRLHLGNLNLVPSDTNGIVSGDLSLRMEGNSLNTIHGDLILMDLKYHNEFRGIELDTVLFVDELIKGGHNMTLYSTFVEASVRGNTSIFDIPYAFSKIAHKYAPSFAADMDAAGRDTTQNFEFSLRVKNDPRLVRFISPDLRVHDPLKVEGNLNLKNEFFELKCDSIDWSFKDFELDRNVWKVYLLNNNLMVTSTANKLNITEGLFLENFNFSGEIRRDSLVTKLKWSNETDLADSGGFNLVLYKTEDYPWNAALNSLKIRVAEVQWVSEQTAHLSADSNSLAIQGLKLTSRTGYVTCDGKMQKGTKNHLVLNVKDLDLSYLSNFGVMQQKVGGVVNASVDLYQQENSVLLDADLTIDSLVVDALQIGTIRGTTEYNDNNKTVSVNLDISYLGNENLKLVGDYYTTRDKNQLDLEASFQGFRVKTVEPFLSEYVSDMDGVVDGSVSIGGNLDKPELNGGLKLNDVALRIKYLNTLYHIKSAPVLIQKDLFAMDAGRITDIYGAEAITTAQVFHTNFSDFTYDIFVQATQFQALNTSLVDNEDYYGQAIVTGDINIGGSVNQTIINITAKTDKGTKMSIPLSGGVEVGEFEYIRFLQPEGFKRELVSSSLEEEKSGLELDFRLSVDDNAEVQIIFDEKVGDIIKVRGVGDMLMQMDNRGKFNMYGDYVISDGDYLFTLQNIVNKKFDVIGGSKIVWNGDPIQAQMDISAIYKLRATPFTMVSSMTGITADDPDATLYQQRLPVNVQLYMDGLMTNPDISFGVNLPSLPESNTANQLLNPNIASQDQITSQAFSLLIANNFSAGAGSVAFGGAGASTGAEMLSNQLSNWASQYSDKLDVGVRYSEGDGEVAASQTQLSVSTDLFNDRVSVELNGSRQGATTANQNTSNLAGEFNVEYKMNKDGSLKARVFNESNSYSAANLNQSPYTQ
jgi:hypothetical protein